MPLWWTYICHSYVSSTPLDRVWDRDFDVLLATRMNGEPLPKHHGAPLRVVLPGLGGARCVKWLTKIEVRKRR